MTALETLAALGELARCAAQPVPSPCISVCRIDGRSGLCVGCFRTLDEIVQWASSGDQDKRRVWGLITRRAGLTPDIRELHTP